MTGQSLTSGQRISSTTRSATSSRGSADGPTLFDWLDGTQTDQSGPAPVHAKASPSQGRGKEKTTPDISGPRSSISSASAALQRSLESRLVQPSVTGGSMIYKETWKERVTPAGTRYLEHTASAHRTSGSGCTGWPTPNTPSGGRSSDPSKMDATGKTEDGRKHTASLEHAVKFAGWPTASSRDVKGGYEGGRIRDGKISTDTPDVVAQLTGTPADRTSAATESTASFRLNPRFSLWLMGFPDEWASCGERAMQSCRKLLRRSSKRAASDSR